MPLTSILTIDGVDYAASDRIAVPIVATGLDRALDGGYDTMTFTEISQNPVPSFMQGMTAALAVDIGSGSVTRFQGEITDVQSQFGDGPWRHAYTALGLKYLSDKVPITAVDGTGTQIYNRSPEDDYYVSSDAGLTIGEMIERILLDVLTAQRLNAVGIGQYTGLPSAPALPAATLADLALLTIVPPRPVVWSGSGWQNTADQQLSQYMPKWYSEIEPDGTIRFKDSTSTTYFVPRTITCPGIGGLGDPVTPPRVRSSTQNCATRLVLRGGPQVEVATLSLSEGTLAEVFTPTDKSNWDLTYFTAPKGAYDTGDVTAVTSTSATLQSDDVTATWAINFWSSNNGTVTLIDPTAPGITQMESRTVTSNNALVAAGTSTVNWDATWPITGTAYSRYTIVGSAGGLVDTWRTYTPCEPATGDTGLDTYVGSHLVVRSPHVVRVANAAGTVGQYYTTAMVKGGSLGQYMPLPVAPVPSEGIFRFFQPTVTVFGQPSFLNTGSPTTNADGLPDDVIIYAMYSRGPLSVTVPPDILGVPQYEGTAYTLCGLERTIYLDFPNWQWINDLTSFTDLAQQHLDSMSNVEWDIDIDWIDFTAAVPGWDFLSFGYSLNIAINGATSPWSAIDAPVRSIGLRFDSAGGPSRLSVSASTRRRAFSGDDLYIHPEFQQGSPLANATGGFGGEGNYGAFNAMLAEGYRPGLGGTTEGGLQGAQIGLQGAQLGLEGAQQGLQGAQQGLVGAQQGLSFEQPQFSLMDTLMAGMPVGEAPQRREADKQEKDRADVDDFFLEKSKGRDREGASEAAKEAAADRRNAANQAKAMQQQMRERRQERAKKEKADLPRQAAERNLDRQIEIGRREQAAVERRQQIDRENARRQAEQMKENAQSKGEAIPRAEGALMGPRLPIGGLSAFGDDLSPGGEGEIRP